MKLATTITTLFIGITFWVQAQHHSKVRIFTDDAGLLQLQKAGVGIDHGTKKQGVWFESDFSPQDLAIIEQQGVQYEVIIHDVVSYYQQRAWQRSQGQEQTLSANCDETAPDYAEPTDFSLGTMGGFYKYNEFIAHIDTMAAKYPNLITAKQAIGSFITYGGDSIYWLRLSDNATVDENEPEVLYTSIHHAREPMSLLQMIYYMYYLLENYGTNDEVTYLVDNVEMYFIPMVNPDGYRYNELNNPNGGGMWRKNRRDNGGGEWGVDLNRNYGHTFGYDNIGSSPDPSSNTYRGPSEFSEPETQAVKDFCENRDIKIALNYHSYGDLLIYPWGYEENIYTPDSAQFVEWAKVMTTENKYTYGTGNQTVGYVVNGDSDDWMYGDQTTIGKVMSYTPEVGSQNDGFWPQVSNIVPLAKENVRQNLNMAHLALQYGIATDKTQEVVEQLSGQLYFDVLRLGLDSPSTFTVTITPVGPELTNVGSPKVFTNLAMLEKQLDSISYTLDGSIQQGQAFSYELKLDNGQFEWRDTLTKFYGTQTQVYSNSANDLNDWTTFSWATTSEDFVSSPNSITDSPFSEYNNNSTTSIELTNPVDLSDAVYATLSFHAKWEIETGWDYAQVEASSDGNNWEPLCGLYTKPGNGFQDQGNPIYDGFQTTWVKEYMSLQDFVGGDVYIRFKLESDTWTTEDGFYFDDLEVTMIEGAPQSIEENELQQVKVFPNPATDVLTIQTGNTDETWEVELYDIAGKLLLQETMKGTQGRIYLEKYRSGTFTLKITAGENTTYHKIVKQ